MTKTIAIGTATFAFLCVVLSLLVQAALELAGVTTSLADHVGSFFFAVPLALLVARRVGRVTHISLLIAGVLIAAATLSAIVFLLNAVAQALGGHFGWRTLFNATNVSYSLLSTAVIVLGPQIWLPLLNRLAANNSVRNFPSTPRA